jgi:hypothetical protein
MEEQEPTTPVLPTLGRIVHVNVGTNNLGAMWRAAIVTSVGEDTITAHVLTLPLDRFGDSPFGRPALLAGPFNVDDSRCYLVAEGLREGVGPSCWRWPPRA